MPSPSASPAAIPVAFVVSQAGKRADGGVRSISLIVEGLRFEGRIRPLFITNAETEQTAAWRASGIEVEVWFVPPPARDGSRRSRASRRLWRAAQILACNGRMARLLRDRGIRVVHCNDHPALWMAAPGARAAGARVLTNIRDTLGVRGLKWKATRALSHRVVVLSDEMKAYVERALAAPPFVPPGAFAAVERIYSLVDLEVMKPASAEERLALRARLGIAPDSLAVGVVAAFVPKKQQLELIRHVAARPDSLGDRTALWFVGDFSSEDPYARACKEAADAAGLAERLHFVGFTPSVADWYRALDLTLIPSREEGLARCMIESLACGTPVVSFDVCSAREILEAGECGVVVRQGDFDGLLAAVEALGSDDARWTRARMTGVRLARERFAPAAVSGEYERLYREMNG